MSKRKDANELYQIIMDSNRHELQGICHGLLVFRESLEVENERLKRKLASRTMRMIEAQKELRGYSMMERLSFKVMMMASRLNAKSSPTENS